MIECIKKGFVQILRDTADKIDAGNSEIDEEQALEIMKSIAHQSISKESAAIYLNMSTSRFDTLVREGYLPKGRKKLGFKEKVWYKDELDKFIENYRSKSKKQ